MLSIPAFGETDYICEKIHSDTKVVLIRNAACEDFERYCNLLKLNGYVAKESKGTEIHKFTAFQKDRSGVFVNAFFAAKELQFVFEANTAYFDYTDVAGEPIVQPLLTQIKLTDYGLSYVIRLSDGRFLVIDGGNRVEEEASALYDCLKEQSVTDTPVIAAWIMTHPHCDHFYCFFPFMERYGDGVEIEKFFFNFPDANDYAHYPSLERVCNRFDGCLDADVVRMFTNAVKEMAVPVYTPHTGQQYQLGNASLTFLGTIDDTIHISQNLNSTSLLFTTEIQGQKVFWGADGSFGDARLPERYGSELKADILQIPHHGFGCGPEEKTIRGYQLISPRVCLLPASHSEAYTSFTTYRESTNYLMTRQGVEEIITGKIQRTLELPYEPKQGASTELKQQYLEGRDNCGARTWIFTDLNTAVKDDFEFSILNTTYIDAKLFVEIYFEGLQKKIIRIRSVGPRLGVFRINCALNTDEDPSVFDGPEFYQNKGIPINTVFAVRFISDIPVVISHRNHTATYHSTVV